MNFKIKLAKDLEVYIEHLLLNIDKGNNLQIYEAFEKACEKVANNPLSKDFIKHSLNEYRAVDVLGQTRAYFKIHSEYNVIFFVWLNPEDFPHDSSKGEFDPCYREFKNLMNSGKLEIYTPQPDIIPEFKFRGKFRTDSNIFTSLKSVTSFSSAQLKLKICSENEYEIEHINESNYYSDTLPVLLEMVVQKAKKEKINLVSFVGIERDNDFRHSVVKALKDVGFALSCTDNLGDTFRLAA